MAILDALQSAALRIAGRRPNTFYGSSETMEMELCDLANEVAKDICAYQDWQRLIRVETLTGPGDDGVFDLPSDYDKMMIRSDMQDLQSWAWGYTYIADVNDFLFQQARGWTITPGAWTLYDNKLQFTPPPSGPATFPYVSKNYAIDSATLERKDKFDADTDEFLLPERLLTLGLVWRWRENKGLPLQGEQEAFVKALSEYADKDKGSRIIRYGGRVIGGFPAWPWIRV